GNRKAQMLPIVRDTCKSVFAPTVGTGTCLIVRKIVPSIACATVVFPHGTPLPFAQIGSPLFPGDITLPCVLQSQLFWVIGCSYHALRSFLAVASLASAGQGVALWAGG